MSDPRDDGREVDIHGALERADGDAEFLSYLCERAVTRAHDDLARLLAAVGEGDPAAWTIAHRVRGALANVGAVGAAAVAAEVEDALRGGTRDPEWFRTRHAELRRGVDHFDRVRRDYFGASAGKTPTRDQTHE